MKKFLAVLVVVALIGFGLWRFSPRGQASAKILAYEVLNTVEYSGHGHYFQQATGTLVVDKRPMESGDVSYTYTFASDVTADGGKTIGQVTLPPVSIIRDPQTERIVGGDRFLKNLGIVANAALDALKGDLPLDGSPISRQFDFDVPTGFPKQLKYELRARKQSLDIHGAAVAALAVSDPFTYSVPGSDLTIRGRHRVLCLLDESMDEVFFLNSNFQATAPEGNQLGELRIESVMSQLDGNEPLSLAGLDEEFTRYFESLDLNTAEPDIASDAALPQWAMHSLAVRDTVDLVASAAIEGKPNFAICATVGMVLLVDSAVSTGTTLLHEAGVIDWKWRGIPNYAGRGVGLAAAKGWEQAMGTEVDEEKWKEIGGVGADIALLFIPDRALGAGLKIGSGGIKVLKGQQLAGKSLRISKYGLDLVNAGRGWHNSVKTAEAVKSLTKVVKGATIVADLIDREKPDTGPSTTTKTPDVPSPIENSIGMVLVPISAGEFLMGSPASEARRIGFETQHRVKLTKSFYLGRTEVTQGQWKAVMGTTPWKGKNFVKEGDDYPANYVDWDDAVEFCRRLSKSQEEKAAGHIYRLPTEAEWEYACRAGTTTDYSFGDDESQLSEYAWCDWNSGDTTHPVGEKKPNPWGLYDMHGNVSEWCQDWYGKYPSANVTDPVGPASGSDRVLRGGNWYRISGDCRSASSCRGTPFIRVSSAAGGLGFRVVRTSGESSEQPVADVASVQKPLPVAKPVGDPIENSIGMVLVPIPAGEFMMGSPESEAGREDNETQHRVKLTKSFYLGKYEVTQEQYGKVMGKNPSNDFRYFDGLIHKLNPVVGVTWYDAVEFCRKLSALPAEKSSGYVYRLPTEAEWEYACRAGTKTKYCFGDSRSELGEYAWYARDQPHGVGQKHPNSWNLYDMHGNVEEWCQDWYGDYPNAAVTDPAGSSPGYGRVTRGGSWTDYSGSGSFRSAVRGEITSEDAYPNLGFRVLRSSIK